MSPLEGDGGLGEVLGPVQPDAHLGPLPETQVVPLEKFGKQLFGALGIPRVHQRDRVVQQPEHVVRIVARVVGVDRESLVRTSLHPQQLGHVDAGGPDHVRLTADLEGSPVHFHGRRVVTLLLIDVRGVGQGAGVLVDHVGLEEARKGGVLVTGS